MQGIADLKALVLDDSPTIRRVFMNILSGLGMTQFAEAENYEQALRELGKGDIGLVLADLYLPGSKDGIGPSGLDLLKHMKQDTELRRVPVVMVTAERKREKIVEAVRLGAVGYVVKPFAREDIRKHVVAAVRRKRASVQEAAGEFEGHISAMPVPEIVQFLSAGRKTGILRIESENRKYRIDFLKGKVVHALAGRHPEPLTGEEAVLSTFVLTDGRFHFREATRLAEANVSRSTTQLLLDGLQRLDENAQ